MLPPDDDETHKSDETSAEDDVGKEGSGKFVPPPTVEDATLAYKDIQEILQPWRKTGAGHKDPGLNLLLRKQLDKIKLFLWAYINATGHGAWISTSLQTTRIVGEGPWCACMLRKWTHTFVIDCNDLPWNLYGQWNVSMLEDEGLAEEIYLHLQSIGKYVKAMDIIHYLNTPEMKERLDHKKTIDLATAQWWMLEMGYQWSHNLKGQYVNDHECEDVVKNRQEVFIPAWKKVEGKMCT